MNLGRLHEGGDISAGSWRAIRMWTSVRGHGEGFAGEATSIHMVREGAWGQEVGRL